MASVTYYVVLPFKLAEDGEVVRGEAIEAPGGLAAIARARIVASAPGNVGAIAFMRTGDPAIGEFDDAKVLAKFGETAEGAG